MEFNEQTQVGAIAAQYPHTIPVLERYGIDFCCGGAKSLRDALAGKNASVEGVLTDLKQAAALRSVDLRWTDASLEALVQHLLERHHTYTRDALAKLEPLFAKVATVHGKEHPELPQALRVHRELAQELGIHLLKEENVLFPYILRLESSQHAGTRLGAPPFGTVANPVRMMNIEHESAGQSLGRLRELTKDFLLPADACNSWKALYTLLAEFEQELHVHIHLESNVLFPRAQRLEQLVAQGGS